MSDPVGYKALAEALVEVVLDTLQQIAVRENIGLDQVDNTSDINKPVSTAQAALVSAAIAALTKADVGLGNVDNTSDVNKPVSTAQQTALNLKANVNNAVFTGTTTLAADPGAALQAATKQYVDATVNALLDAANAEQFKGLLDCSTNPNYPAANAGWTYRVSVAGKIGGASGTDVEVGDRVQCIVDSSAAGTQAAVGANWWITQANILFSSNGVSLVTAANYAAMKTLLSLGNVDNTSDANKPVSTATQTALNLKANLASPAFTGAPTAEALYVNNTAPMLNEKLRVTGATVATSNDTFPVFVEGNAPQGQAGFLVFNSAASHVDNRALFGLQVNTTAGRNSAFTFSAKFSDVTDATRTSQVSMLTAVGGSTTTAATVTGRDWNFYGTVTASFGTPTPAGGSTAARLLFGTTAGFGIYYGSGVPTVSAGQGSIYLRSDGSSTSTRLYVNTNGSTGWTNFTSAA